MVIEERPKDANRNGASAALRPRTSSQWETMGCVPRVDGISSIARNRFGMNLDRRAPWPRAVAQFRDDAPRGRSSIITAHAKMQFKLQVYVIVSRSRRGKRFRPDGGWRSVTNDPIKRIRAAFLLRRGNARSAHRYIHHDPWLYTNQRGNMHP